MLWLLVHRGSVLSLFFLCDCVSTFSVIFPYNQKQIKVDLWVQLQPVSLTHTVWNLSGHTHNAGLYVVGENVGRTSHQSFCHPVMCNNFFLALLLFLSLCPIFLLSWHSIFQLLSSLSGSLLYYKCTSQILFNWWFFSLYFISPCPVLLRLRLVIWLMKRQGEELMGEVGRSIKEVKGRESDEKAMTHIMQWKDTKWAFLLLSSSLCFPSIRTFTLSPNNSENTHRVNLNNICAITEKKMCWWGKVFAVPLIQHVISRFSRLLEIWNCVISLHVSPLFHFLTPFWLFCHYHPSHNPPPPLHHIFAPRG